MGGARRGCVCCIAQRLGRHAGGRRDGSKRLFRTVKLDVIGVYHFWCILRARCERLILGLQAGPSDKTQKSFLLVEGQPGTLGYLQNKKVKKEICSAALIYKVTRFQRASTSKSLLVQSGGFPVGSTHPEPKWNSSQWYLCHPCFPLSLVKLGERKSTEESERPFCSGVGF